MRCAKVQVSCWITTLDGDEFYGTNACLVPQKECPRLPDEGYEKCKSICFQLAHAEEMAVYKGLMSGANLKGATAEITHERICDRCRELFTLHGITNIVLQGLT